MLLKSKDIAYVSVMTAISVLLIVISGYIESSTLFFLAAASFLSGVVEDRLGVIPSIFHVVCTVILGIFLAPQKLYCITFMSFGIYIVFAEYIEQCKKKKDNGWLIKFSWVLKCCLFEVMLLVMIVLYEQFIGIRTIFSGDFTRYFGSYTTFMIALFVVAQAVWVVFDRAYIYFMKRYGKMFHTKRR